MRVAALSALMIALVAGLPVSEAQALGPLKADIVGIEVAEQVVAGIPGGQPWVVSRGNVRIGLFGVTRINVKGLLLLNGTVGPVFDVFASLHCASGATGEEAFSEAARTGAVPLSAEGDFRIVDRLELPDQCTAPIVLVRIKTIDAGFVGGPPGVPLDLEADLGLTAPWIAASGL